jgi:hypothetical protein
MIQTAIEQTTATVGTGSYALSAPTDALRISFVAGVGSGNRAWYRAESGSAWEEGWGVATAGSPDTLTRNVVRSSNGNALVNWGAGTKRIYCPLLADAARAGAGGQVPTAGGTANARTLAFNPAHRAVLPGMVFAFVNGAAANTGAATLAVDGTAALPVQARGAALAGGELPASAPVRVMVNGDATAFLLLPPPPSAALAALLAAADLPAARGALQLGAFSEATRTTLQSIPHNTFTTVSWEAAPINDLGAWAAGAPTLLTVPAGVSRARVTCSLVFGGAAVNSERIVSLRRNGSEVRRMGTSTTALGAVIGAQIDGLFAVSAGDTFEVQVLQSTGGALNVLVGGSAFAMELVR